MRVLKRTAAGVVAAFTLTLGTGIAHTAAAETPQRKPSAVAVATAGPVKPGAFCSPEGAVGQTVNGVWMKCSYAPGDSYKRWRVK